MPTIATTLIKSISTSISPKKEYQKCLGLLRLGNQDAMGLQSKQVRRGVLEREMMVVFNLKNRTTVPHGTLRDLVSYLIHSGWKLEKPLGEYEVLRARKKGYPRPLLIHDRTSGGCGYSIDERDITIYKGWKRNRRKRGLPTEETEEERVAGWHDKDWRFGE